MRLHEWNNGQQDEYQQQLSYTWRLHQSSGNRTYERASWQAMWSLPSLLLVWFLLVALMIFTIENSCPNSSTDHSHTPSMLAYLLRAFVTVHVIHHPKLQWAVLDIHHSLISFIYSRSPSRLSSAYSISSYDAVGSLFNQISACLAPRA